MTAICQKKNKGMRAWLRKNAVGYAFLMPFLVLFAIFVIVPVGVAMYYSLTNYNMIQAPKFVGLSNYAQLILDDDVFWRSSPGRWGTSPPSSWRGLSRW